MANEAFLEKLSSGLGQSATVKSVFGEPIRCGEKTIVPVAKVAYGFGGGFGQGLGPTRKQAGAEQDNTGGETQGEGAGGGGGLYATPKGVYEISPACTRFIPASSARVLLIGVAAGFLLKALLFSGKK